MPEAHEIYEPREDTYLILEEVKKLANGNVLDMGTGSGILALAAALKAKHVIGVDINPDAVEFAKETAKASGLTNIQFAKSDLFEFFESNHPWRFDLIIFNPPYLPAEHAEPKEIQLATTGGKKGYEIIEKFFSKASRYLMPYGKILILFSSLTGKEQVHDIMEKNAFNFQKLSEEDFFAETIFVYLAEKSDLLRELESSHINYIQKMAKGHRGLIYKGVLDKRPVVIKKQREDIHAIGRIENEARWLKVLNRKNIGPKFIFFRKDFFVYHYVKGEFLPAWLKKATKKEIKKVLANIFKQCFIMDKMKINKEEMHNPYKHILVDKNKPVMLDFERTHATDSPKNVTQFCQYVSSARLKKTLQDKNIKIDRRKMQGAARQYKKTIKEENLKKIISLIR